VIQKQKCKEHSHSRYNQTTNNWLYSDIGIGATQSMFSNFIKSTLILFENETKQRRVLIIDL